MKYPNATVSQPLSQKQAERVERAVKTGKGMTNPAYRSTIERLVEQANSEKENGQNDSAIRAPHRPRKSVS